MHISKNDYTSGLPEESDEMLTHARNGDHAAREQLLLQYVPFIFACVSRVCRRQITRSDDEASIGLQAFNEAIDYFDHTKGANFLTFCELVIRRRVIDYLRKTQPPINVEYLDDSLPDDRTVDQYERAIESIDRNREVNRYKKRLAEFGITLSDLSRNSPKHKDARNTAINIASIITDDAELKQMLMSKKAIPIKEMLERPDIQIGVSRKTVERNRKYIIGIALILTGDYPYLREYIDI